MTYLLGPPLYEALGFLKTEKKMIHGFKKPAEKDRYLQKDYKHTKQMITINISNTWTYLPIIIQKYF